MENGVCIGATQISKPKHADRHGKVSLLIYLLFLMIVFVSVTSIENRRENDLLVYVGLGATGGTMLLLILFLAIYFAAVKPKEDQVDEDDAICTNHVCVD